MSSGNGTYYSSAAEWGLGIGCTIATVLMIISWGCFAKSVYDCLTYEPPTPTPPPPPPPASPTPLSPSRPVVSTPSAPPAVSCLLPICQEYLQSLNLDVYFEKGINCFCMRCRRDTSKKTYGNGGYDCTIPYGWVRFHIRMEEVLKRDKQIFRRWATSYYGTWAGKLEQILRNRFIPLPGDRLLGDTTFRDHSRDKVHCFTSPSIDYTSDWQRSPKNPFTLSNGRVYDVQIILECKQKPETFVIQPGKPGLCNIIPSTEIEWISNQRSTIIPKGLMVKMVAK